MAPKNFCANFHLFLLKTVDLITFYIMNKIQSKSNFRVSFAVGYNKAFLYSAVPLISRLRALYNVIQKEMNKSNTCIQLHKQ